MFQRINLTQRMKKSSSEEMVASAMEALVLVAKKNPEPAVLEAPKDVLYSGAVVCMEVLVV